MKLAAICDRDTAVGFRLSGIKDIFIPNGNNALHIFNKIQERDDIGILFITEKIVEDLDKHLQDFRVRNIIPIIVEIPDKKGRKKEHVDYVSHLIKKAVGIEVEKEKI
jgi:V/A-type H+-transporting ATPase subunit F